MASAKQVSLALLLTLQVARADELGARPISQAAQVHLKSAVAAYRGARYAEALSECNLGQAIEMNAEFLYLMGQSERMMGHCDQAIGHYEAALSLARSPEQRGLIRVQIERCAQELPPKLPTPAPGPKLEPELAPTLRPPSPREGGALIVDVAPGNAGRRLEVFYRTMGQSVFSGVTGQLGPGGLLRAVVPGSQVRAPRLEFFVRALNEEGSQVAAGGSLGHPLEVSIGRKPVYRRASFWGAIGGVLAAGVVAAAISVPLVYARSHDGALMLNPH